MIHLRRPPPPPAFPDDSSSAPPTMKTPAARSPAAFRAPIALAALAALAPFANTASADLVWLDIQSGAANAAPLHQVLDAADGASVGMGGITFTLVGKDVEGGSREYAQPMLRDFAALDGQNAAITLRIAGLPAGAYVAESWHFDQTYPGSVSIGYGPAGAAPEVLVADHLFSPNPASYLLRADGTTVYELTFRESGTDNRCRFNGFRLRAADAPPGPPGVFIDIDYTNTQSVTGFPDPFFTDNAENRDFISGSLWRRRPGFGSDLGRNREIFEKDANEAVGDAVPLVTIARGLRPGATYGAYVVFISPPGENWQVKAGLAANALTLYTPKEPAGRVTDLGLTSEAKSNRHHYLGFLGNVTIGPDEALWLYSDDGDGTDTGWRTRTWLDGFYLGAPR